MAEFILIGSNEKMQEIVTGIREYQPQSTCSYNISTGIILHSEEGVPEKYHSVDTNTNTEENLSLENYLLNQLAHHRANSSKSDVAVNIFLLCSLYDKQDIEDIKFLYDGLRSLIDNDTNVTIIWMLFSFDIVQSPDVKRRASKEDIKQVLDLCKELPIKEGSNLPLFVSKVLYINNRDMNNAAVDLNNICNPHNFIVDFLSGFFYLSSNPSDEYDIINSCSGDIFSIGYADYAYRPQDVSRYLSLHLQFNRLTDMFNSNVQLNFDYTYENIDDAVDSIQSIATVFPDPKGLNQRKLMLDTIYAEPGFDTIGKYRTITQNNPFAWVFGAQDYYLQKMKPFVDTYNNYCEEKKKEATENYEKALEETLVNNSEPPNQELFFADVPESLEYLTWPDVLCACPQGKITKAEATHLREVFSQYQSVKTDVLTDDFFDKLQSAQQNENVEKEKVASSESVQENGEDRSGCLFAFFNLFKRKSENTTNGDVSNNEEKQPLVSSNQEKLREYWSLFNQLENYKTIYTEFTKKYEEIEDQKVSIEEQINKFQVYEHKKSVSLIDVSKLHNYSDSMLQEMLSTLETLRKEGELFITLDAVCQKANEVIEMIESKWNKLNWESPFIFICDMSKLDTPIEYMQQNNSVFIDTKQDSTENVLKRMYIKIYSNSEQQIEKINILKDNHKIRNAQFISASKSNHILNRLCMYRIINVTLDELKDLQ